MPVYLLCPKLFCLFIKARAISLVACLSQRGFDLLPENRIRLGTRNQLAVDQEARRASHPSLEPIRQVLLDLIAVPRAAQAGVEVFLIQGERLRKSPQPVTRKGAAALVG